MARPEVTETPSPGVIFIAASVVAGADADAEASDELLEAESSSLPQAASIKSAAVATARTRVSDFFFINGALPRVPVQAAGLIGPAHPSKVSRKRPLGITFLALSPR